MSSKTHILTKTNKWTFCGSVGRGPHSTVYAIKQEEVKDSTLLRPYLCKRCLHGFSKTTEQGTMHAEPPNTEFRKFLEFQLRLHSLGAKTSKDTYSVRQHVQMCFLIARQLGLITKG